MFRKICIWNPEEDLSNIRIGHPRASLIRLSIRGSLKNITAPSGGIPSKARGHITLIGELIIHSSYTKQILSEEKLPSKDFEKATCANVGAPVGAVSDEFL